jgi:uncharacterized protein (TIGR03086 family)
LPLVSEQVELLESVLHKTGALMAAVPPDAARRSTPCPDFDVAALVDHLAEWLTTFATSAAGSPPPVAGDDGQWPEPAVARFQAAADSAIAAFRAGAEDRALTLMSGPVPGSMVLGMMLMEYLAHGWDLAVATAQPVPFDEAEAEAALAVGRQILSPEYRGPGQSFDQEVPVPPDASAVERLIGFLGRDPAANTA